jgi:hypothetical protein
VEYSSRAIDVDGIALAARGPRCGQVRVVYLADRLADVSADTAHLRLRRIIQTIADLGGKPWAELRILDLGSLEGLFAIECAV